jgi:hypothetical protein
LAICLVLGLGLARRAEAAKLSSFLTAQDLSRPVLLDQSGKQLQLPSPNHPHPVTPEGSTPTYLAFPLNGGEHLPSGLATFKTGPQRGQTELGPLDVDAQLIAKLNTAIDESGMAVVDTPSRNYLVGFVPRHGKSQEQSQAGSTTTTTTETSSSGGESATPPLTYNGVHFWLASSASQSAQSSSESATAELSHLLQSGSGQLIKWSANSIAEMEKLVTIGNPKPTATQPSLNLEAQVLAPPLATASSTGQPPLRIPDPLPPPIPEPSTWMVFGLILSAAGLRQALRGRRGAGA